MTKARVCVSLSVSGLRAAQRDAIKKRLEILIDQLQKQ